MNIRKKMLECQTKCPTKKKNIHLVDEKKRSTSDHKEQPNRFYRISGYFGVGKFWRICSKIGIGNFGAS